MPHLLTLGSSRIEPARFQSGGLAFLALTRLALTPRKLGRETLIDALWTAETPSRLNQRFRQLNFSLRRAYPELNLRADDGFILFDRTRLSVDWLEAVQFASENDLLAALRLQNGPFLSGCRLPTSSYEHWVDGIRAGQARYVRRWLHAVLTSGDPHLLELQAHLPVLGAILPADPVLELVRARILQWNGRISAARAALKKCQRKLPASCNRLAKAMQQELRHARAGKMSAARGTATPFVGRSYELGLLQQAWRNSCSGALVTCEISGEAGVGKTRLSNQFARWVALQGGKPLLLRGDKPFNESLHDLVGSLGMQPPAQALDTTAARYWADSVEVVLSALSATAAKQPILLSIDDYQLTDSAVHQLVHMITVRLPKKPLLLLIIARSQRGMADMPASVIVRLGPMSDDEARQLITASSVQPLASNIADAIIARSTKLPLALLAWVHLVGQETSADQQAAMVATTAPSSLLHDLVQRRSPAARSILRCLSLIRPAYPLRALLATTGIRREEMEMELENLVAEGLVTWSDGGVQLAHALYRLDSAVALENESATLKHRMIALSLMSCGSRYFHEIARQLDLAGDYGEAVRYYVRAARVAVRSANRSNAEECIAEALRLCRAHDIPEGHVQLATASMYYEWEEYGVAAPAFREALKSSLSLTRRSALQARIRFVRAAVFAGTMRPGEDALRSLLKTARRSGDTALEMEVAYTLLTCIPYDSGNQGFRRLAEDFRDISSRSPDERVATRALVQSSILYFAGALVRIGEHFGREALRRAQAIADDHTLVDVAGCLGAIQAGRGQLEEASQTFAIGLGARKRLGYTPRRQLWFTNYGVYLLERGQWEEAERVFQEGLEQNQQAGTEATFNAHVRLNFALLYYEWGRYSESLQYAAEFVRSDLHKSPERSAGAALVGLIALERNDVRSALHVATLLCNTHSFFGDESYHNILQARILASQGSKSAALELLTAAHRRLRRRYYPAAARVQLEILRLQDHPDTSQLLAFAADCDRRGLDPLAERARAAASQPLIR